MPKVPRLERSCARWSAVGQLRGTSARCHRPRAPTCLLGRREAASCWAERGRNRRSGDWLPPWGRGALSPLRVVPYLARSDSAQKPPGNIFSPWRLGLGQSGWSCGERELGHRVGRHLPPGLRRPASRPAQPPPGRGPRRPSQPRGPHRQRQGAGARAASEPKRRSLSCRPPRSRPGMQPEPSPGSARRVTVRGRPPRRSRPRRPSCAPHIPGGGGSRGGSDAGEGGRQPSRRCRLRAPQPRSRGARAAPALRCACPAPALPPPAAVRGPARGAETAAPRRPRPAPASRPGASRGSPPPPRDRQRGRSAQPQLGPGLGALRNVREGRATLFSGSYERPRIAKQQGKRSSISAAGR